MITASGIGSGIDIESIVTQLMTLEREPVDRLERKRERLDVELSAYGSARSAMSTLADSTRTLGDAGKFGPFEATSGDDEVFTATASGTAAAESHEIEVREVATAHRIGLAGGGPDGTSIGRGDWTFGSGDDEFSITVDDGNDTIAALRDAINDAPENEGMVASVLDVDAGPRLVLTARETGIENRIEARRDYTENTGFLGAPEDKTQTPFEEITPAKDARLVVDGFEVTSSGNTVAGVIEGVSIEVTGVGKSTLDTSRNMESLQESLTAFVDNYNTLIADMTRLSQETLQGDRLPRNVESSLRTAFYTDIELADGTTLSPLELGFTFDKAGKLSLDTTRLNEARDSGLESFIDAFARPESGFGARVEDLLSRYTSAGGRLDGREDGVERRRSTLDGQIDRYEYRLEQTETRYRRQFTAMDGLVSELQTTSGFLADRLAYGGGS